MCIRDRWAFKAVAVAASLAGIALVAVAAGRLGHSRRWAAAFVGLNPVLLVMAVGGAHNDTLVMMLLGAAVLLTAGRSPRLRAATGAMAVGVGIKVTAGLALPFIVLAAKGTRERLRVAGYAVQMCIRDSSSRMPGLRSHEQVRRGLPRPALLRRL